MQFVVFEKLSSASCTKLQEKSFYYLFKMNMKKHHQKSRKAKFWKCACAICNLHSYFNFAPMLHENALVFSQLEAHIFSCKLLILDYRTIGHTQILVFVGNMVHIDYFNSENVSWMDLGPQKGNLNQLKEDVSAYPLCILKKTFACFLPVKVLQIFLSVC